MDKQTVKAGTWVQIETTVLAASERAEHLPEETKKCPLIMYTKGYLKEDSSMGEEVTITTVIGRTLKGKLIAVNPPYTHTFGKPVPELLGVGDELRSLISGGQRS